MVRVRGITFFLVILLTIGILNVVVGDIPEDEFIQLVLQNISDANNYVLPSNNEDLTKLTDSENVSDFGTFDFIIVGAGAAGSVLANRLSEIPNWNILLLEAGGKEDYFSDIPGMNSLLSFSDMNWGYLSTSQKTCCLGMKNNQCMTPRGKVIGGSTTINAKQYVRGNKDDYNKWEKMGNSGWGYAAVLPYFKKLENYHIEEADIGYHGLDGPLDIDHTEPTIFTSVFLNANQELGLSRVDFNGKQQIGVGPSAVFLRDGLKAASAGRCYIDPIATRKNLKIVNRAFVTKLVIEGETKTATGVEFICQGSRYLATASKEVLLSAGSINSPQILMLSGIGSEILLKKLGIEVVQNLPVGENLKDHPMYIAFLVKTNQTAFNNSASSLLKDYLSSHRPYTAAFNADSTCFFNTNDIKADVPDIELFLITPPGLDAGKAYHLKNDQRQMFEENFNSQTDILIYIILLHEKSTGNITLKSKYYKDFPNINLNYFSDEGNEDINVMYKGILYTLKLLETSAFKSMNATFRNVVSGCDEHEKLSKEYWYCAIRHLSTSMYHPVGTTRMGTDPRHSVVTPELKVHGMNKLRVIDAGVIPEITSGPTVAATHMLAEKLSDEIKKEYGK